MSKNHINNELLETELALKNMKRMTKEIEIPEDDLFFEKMHDRIMGAIEQTEIKPLSPMYLNKDLFKKHWRNGIFFSAILGLTLVAFSFVKNMSFQIFQNSHAIQSAKNEDKIINIVSQQPNIVSETVLSYKMEQDLFNDVVVNGFSGGDIEDTLTKELLESL